MLCFWNQHIENSQQIVFTKYSNRHQKDTEWRSRGNWKWEKSGRPSEEVMTNGRWQVGQEMKQWKRKKKKRNWNKQKERVKGLDWKRPDWGSERVKESREQRARTRDEEQEMAKEWTLWGRIKWKMNDDDIMCGVKEYIFKYLDISHTAGYTHFLWSHVMRFCPHTLT